MRLFVAFDTGDQLAATALVRILRRWFGDGLGITFSPEFAFGEAWRDRLGEAMQGADILLALCTRRSLGNRWIHFEAGAFFGRGKSVIPVTLDGLKPEDLPEPLNTFQAPNLEVAFDMARLAGQIASMARLPLPPNAADASIELRAMSTTGLPKGEGTHLDTLLSSWHLEPNVRAREVMASASSPYRMAIDDLIVLYANPGWQGLLKRHIVCQIRGRRSYPSDVIKVAQEYQESRADKDDNKCKLGLVQIDPFMTDRDHLRLIFEEMRYFDFEGPRRALFKDNVPTTFARKHYLNKELPEQIPTPLACVHTILITGDHKHLVLGLRRKAAKSDFYDNRLCVSFEEQMSPDDEDIIGTVKRGLRQEAGIQNLADQRIELLAIGLEASFFSIAPIAIAWLDCNAEDLHRSIQLNLDDHEWDALFVPNDTRYLIHLLRSRLPKWSELNPTHFLTFKPLQEYEWHGTSRARLFAYLARKEGIGRLIKM